ncbi:recombinase zinc beta ribbon domain-containing protein [Frigidibacter sp. MR17.24]|uniref:recombinase zinc beta ribbon domain-containing protein n=1 Tax=Frigidibacter sp. MR17.24 TaxID=3127345 RepID=UPI003012FF91
MAGDLPLPRRPARQRDGPRRCRCLSRHRPREPAEEQPLTRRAVEGTRTAPGLRLGRHANREGCVCRSGPGASAIRSTPKRGTRVPSTELYIGRLIWNRQTFETDPRTGRRPARHIPGSEWVIREVPELRIISEALWQQVKDRQDGRKIKHTMVEAWERRKPRFLPTGLMKCGNCGGGFSTVGTDRFGCSSARNKGKSYCDNTVTVTRQDMDGRIPNALSNQLIDPDLTRAFVEEYIAERNRLASTCVDDGAGKQRELNKIKRDQDKLVTALLNGMTAGPLNARLEQLEARKTLLEAELAEIAKRKKNTPTLLHPGIAKTYHQRVTALVAALSEPEHEGEAKELLRGLIDRITVTPIPGPGKRRLPRIDLQGSLIDILELAVVGERELGKQKASCERRLINL